MSITDGEMCYLFRCSPDELDDLKQACKEEMLQTHVYGKPIIHHSIEEVDSDGAIREDIWQSVADSHGVFESMLSGSRWGAEKPCYFGDRLGAAKNQMVWEQGMREHSKEHACRFSLLMCKTDLQNAIHESGSPGWSSADTFFDRHALQKRRMELLPSSASAKRRFSSLVSDVMADTPTKGQTSECDHHPTVLTVNSSDPTNVQVGPDSVNSSYTQRSNGYPNAWMPYTPSNPPSTDDSDTSLAPETSSGSIVSESHDPFRDSPSVSSSGSEHLHPDSDRDSDSEMLPVPFPNLRRERTRLSTRIQTAVHDAMADVKGRIARLEESVLCIHGSAGHEDDLEARLIAKIETMLLARDAEIERLGYELDAKRSWRAT